MPAAFPDLDAPIVAGVSAAGISLRSSVRQLVTHAHPYNSEQLPTCVLYSFQSVKVWAVDGLVHQVGVYPGYRGLLDGSIGIGSTIAAIEDWCGCSVEEDAEDDLIAPGKPGWYFETEAWSGDQAVRSNRNAAIVAIFVNTI